MPDRVSKTVAAGLLAFMLLSAGGALASTLLSGHCHVPPAADRGQTARCQWATPASCCDLLAATGDTPDLPAAALPASPSSLDADPTVLVRGHAAFRAPSREPPSLLSVVLRI